MSKNPTIDFSIIRPFLSGMKPDPILTVSEWADQFRILGPTSAEPGPFKTSRTPYLKEIADKLSVHNVAQKIIFKKSSQVGATETGNNWLGYIIDIAPSTMLYVMPTDAMMRGTSKKRIQPMIDTTPRVRAKIKPNKAKDSGNTILEKYFIGGSVSMVGANSPVGLASSAIRFVYLDEIDRYPMDVAGEGSASSLAETRTITFGARKKIFITSTPTKKGQSAIDSEFDKTGQRYYHVPCPHCGVMQPLFFEQLKYEQDRYDNVTYQCAHCSEQIQERFKSLMFEKGQWIAKNPEKEDGYTYGYFINALYSPYGWYSWGQMVKDYIDSEGDIPKRITWVNTKKGECYEEEADVPDWEMLYALRENYPQRTAKASVAFITAGVDVQADRLEVEIVGWIKGKRSQSIDYRVISGDTSISDTWDKLEVLLSETIIREDNTPMKIVAMAVDTGYNTSYVYEFCSRQSVSGRVIPVKGQDSLAMIYSAPKAVRVTREGQKITNVKVFHVGVSMIKSELYGFLKQVPKDDGSFPIGYCHFPQYAQEYFKGITAEKLQLTMNTKGYNVYQWVKSYKRNEPLDCRVYARAAASVYGMDLFNDQHWERLLQYAAVKKEENSENKTKKRKGSGFWGE